MFDFTHAKINHIAVHHIGNKLYENQQLILSNQLLAIQEPELRATLKSYFIEKLETEELHALDIAELGKRQHPVYSITERFFSGEQQILETSIQLANLLYDCTMHPNIKPGDLFVLGISDVIFDDELVDGLGIFKVENKKSFLTLNDHLDQMRIHQGIDLSKLDKAAILFNLSPEDGFRARILDTSNRSFEAHYWRDLFLKLKPVSSDFYQTKNYMNITKSYVSNQMSTDFDIQKADQIDLLNKSVNYFKEEKQFDENTFAELVFDDPQVIQSFNRYKDEYVDAHQVQLVPQFEISVPAVKKYQRSFRSVIKLDKNFHIYIHGDKSKIEKGSDHTGRKFYKLFFDQES